MILLIHSDINSNTQLFSIFALESSAQFSICFEGDT